MSNLRKSILTRIEKKAALDKQAEDVVNDINDAETLDGQAFAHKVFMDLVNGLEVEIDGLDD